MSLRGATGTVEVVVFNQATGSTHLLGELGGEIFRRLVAAREGRPSRRSRPD
jgi:hypothetical protein